MPKRNRTNAQLAEEARRVLELTSQGMNQRDIAKQMTEEGMPISQPTVHRRAELALELFVIPQGDDAKKQELARIDAVIASQGPKMAAGDSKAADVVLKAIALRARLLGLEAPNQTQVEVSGPRPQILQRVEDARLRAIEGGR